MAARVGVSRQAVSKWECAESSPDTDNLIALALLYQVTVDELLFADPEQNVSAHSVHSADGAGGQAEPSVAPVTERVEEAAAGAAGAAASPAAEWSTGWGGSDDDEAKAPAGPDADPSSGWADCCGDPDYVNVTFDNGIHVRDSKKGEEVHVGWDGIHVDTPTEHVHLDFAGLARAIRELRKQQR